MAFWDLAKLQIFLNVFCYKIFFSFIQIDDLFELIDIHRLTQLFQLNNLKDFIVDDLEYKMRGIEKSINDVRYLLFLLYRITRFRFRNKDF